MQGWLFGLGVGACVFAALVIVGWTVRGTIRLDRDQHPLDRDQHPYERERRMRLLTGWRSMAAALLLGGAAGLAVWAATGPQPPVQIGTPQPVDPALDRRLDELVAAQERTAAAQARAAEALARLAEVAVPVEPPRRSWVATRLPLIFLAIATVLGAAGLWIAWLVAEKGRRGIWPLAAAFLLSGSIFGGFAMIGELRLSPTLELSLLKWTDARSPEPGTRKGDPSDGSALPVGLEADCRARLQIGPFRPGGWEPLEAAELQRLADWMKGREARGYLLIGSTDPRPFRRDGYPGNNAELAQARAETAARAIRDMNLQPAPLLMVLNSSLPVARMTGVDEATPGRREVVVCRLIAADA